MKAGTKFLVGTLAVIGALTVIPASWLGLRRGTIAAQRIAPPGYASTRYLTDAAGRQVAMVFIYPPLPGTTVVKTFTVPIDASKPGYWGTG